MLSLVDSMTFIVPLVLVLSSGLNEGFGITHTFQECDGSVRFGHNYCFWAMVLSHIVESSGTVYTMGEVRIA